MSRVPVAGDFLMDRQRAEELLGDLRRSGEVFIVGMVREVIRPEWIEALAGSNTVLANAVAASPKDRPVTAQATAIRLEGVRLGPDRWARRRRRGPADLAGQRLDDRQPGAARVGRGHPLAA